MDFTNPAVLIALTIAFGAGLATVLGSLLVIFARETNTRLLSFGLAFAAGAMVYISLVEIFTKANQSFVKAAGEKAGYGWTTLFFFAGVVLLIALDRLIPNPHHGLTDKDVGERMGKPAPASAGAAAVETSGEGYDRAKIARVGLLAALAITAHNLPEGLATFFATLDNPVVGAPLAIAIAVHNIPEGVSIAVPVYYATGSKTKAVLATAVSGLAEPFGAIVGYAVLAPFLNDFIFGSVFAVIAGAMVFLALDELLPAARSYARGHETVYGMVIGMAAMALSLVMFK
ncbi:MAG: zinc transporter ZupT [Alphaproteobacteria bacterium]|nr:zinc transporter ZupT [Alphaproteobacteria bacterium]